MGAFISHHWIAFALLFVVLICALGATFASDALLKYEYKFCRDQWEADGSLPGLFWTVSGATDMFTSYMRSWPLRWRWFFSTPDWIRGVKPLERRLRLLRTFSLLGSVAGVLLIIDFTVTI